MNQSFKVLICYFLSFLIGLSSISVVLSTHYCHGKAVEVTLFAELDGCSMEIYKPTQQESLIIERSCCLDQHIFHQAEDELSANPAIPLPQSVLFFDSSISNETTVHVVFSKKRIDTLPPAPMPDRNKLALLQIYRI